MSTKFARSRRALLDLDAARRRPDGEALDGRALADLADILGQPGPGSLPSGPRSPRPSRLMTTVSLVGLAALIGALVLAIRPAGSDQGGGGGSELAATPVALTYVLDGSAGSARDQLLAIADRAAALPTADARGGASGRFEHLRYQQWSLFTRIDDKQVTSAVVPQQIEQWQAADGSGKRVQTYVTPLFRDHAEERAWRDAGSPGKSEPPMVMSGLSRMWSDRPPTDTAALTAWLRRGHPAANGPQETMVAISDLVKQDVLSSQERAAVLRVLADVPGLVELGTTTDRAGRPVMAVAVDTTGSGLPTRHTLLVDPSTGAILGYEQMLTQSPGKLNVPIPSIIGYDLYLVADRTDTAG
jgi:hypothetical protein